MKNFWTARWWVTSNVAGTRAIAGNQSREGLAATKRLATGGNGRIRYFRKFHVQPADPHEQITDLARSRCIQRIQQLSNHLANWVPSELLRTFVNQHTLLTSVRFPANDDPQDKRIKKLELLKLCLPNDWERISRRELMRNYMDPEMCGKWVVRVYDNITARAISNISTGLAETTQVLVPK